MIPNNLQREGSFHIPSHKSTSWASLNLINKLQYSTSAPDRSLFAPNVCVLCTGIMASCIFIFIFIFSVFMFAFVDVLYIFTSTHLSHVYHISTAIGSSISEHHTPFQIPYLQMASSLVPSSNNFTCTE